MTGRWSFSLVIEGLKNLSPRTRRMTVFWLVVVAGAEMALVVSGNAGILQAGMLGATVAFILAVEIGQDIKRYVNSQPEPKEESALQTATRDVDPFLLDYRGDGKHDAPAIDAGAGEASTGEATAVIAVDAAAETADAAAEIATGVAEGAADAAGEAVAEVFGGIISGS